MFGVWELLCDICGYQCVAVIPCNADGDWPMVSGGTECAECGNMSMYPREDESEECDVWTR